MRPQHELDIASTWRIMTQCIARIRPALHCAGCQLGIPRPIRQWFEYLCAVFFEKIAYREIVVCRVVFMHNVGGIFDDDLAGVGQQVK